RTHDVISLDIREAFRQRVLDGLAVSPVVTAVAGASSIPLSANATGVAAVLPGRSDLLRTRYRFVSPGFFDLFDIPIVAGRNFTSEEARAGARVAIVSETIARQWWPERDAVGQSVRIVPDARTDAAARIRRFAEVHVIGIVRDTAADVGEAGPM